MKKFVYVIISALFIAACNIGEMEFDDLQLTPISGPFVFQLGETNYVMRDLIGNQTGDSLNFQEDSTSLLTLVYYDTITYNTPDEFIRINDIVQTGATNPPAYPAGAARQETFTASFDLTYDPEDGEVIDELYYLTGDITIVTTSDIMANVDYEYTIQNTNNVNNGDPVVLNGTVNNGTNNATQSLINHVTRLTGGNNTFTVDLEATVNLAAAQSLTGLEEFSFELTYGNQSFGLTFGRFGQDTVQVGDQQLEIDFFTQAARDGITFGNPTLTFDFRNSFGVPVEADFAGLSGRNDSIEVFLTGDIVNIPPVIAGSDVSTPAVGVPGETVQTVVEINRTNSNLVNILSSSPDEMNFNVVGRSNPESLTAQNYVQPTSEITAYVELEVPMEVQLEDYNEIGGYSLREGFNANNLDSAFIRIVTLNELPFTGTIDIEVQAADSTVLFPITDTNDPRYDSALAANPNQIERLTNIPAIKAPLISISGDVTDPSGETSDVGLTNEEVQLLSTAARVIVTMTLNTPVSQTSRDIYVRVLADYTMELKIGVGGRFNLDLLEYD